MNPELDPLKITRRHFLRGRGRPHRRRGPREPLERHRARCADPFRAEGEARHLPLPVRRRRRSWICSMTSRCSASATARSCRPSVRGGQRLTGDVGQPDAPPARRIAVRVRAARPERRARSASCCRTSRRSRTTVLHPVDAHRGDQPRPGHHVLPDRLADRRPAVASGSWLSYGLGSRKQDLPAFIVLITGSGGRRSAALCAPVGHRLSAVQIPGRALPQRQGPGALPLESRRRHRGADGARCSTASTR